MKQRERVPSERSMYSGDITKRVHSGARGYDLTGFERNTKV